MDSNFSYGNPTQQLREAEMYHSTRPYFPYNNPAPVSGNEVSDEEYHPESIQSHVGTASSSRPQSTILPDLKALQQSNAVKLHIKTLDWNFDFEGPYLALFKILESLGSIARDLSHKE